MQTILYQKIKKIMLDLGKLDIQLADHQADSLFKEVTGLDRKIGYCDRGCEGAILILPGPTEARGKCHLHIEERFDSSAPYDLTYYRYEICWEYDLGDKLAPNDYMREVLLSLRRGVRFDHHPKDNDTHHPKFHWHPNGCSEFRLDCGQMSPLKVGLVAYAMFAPDKLFGFRQDDQLNVALNELDRQISGLIPSPT